MEKYKSVSCDFYDQLEAFAVKKLKSAIVYQDDSGQQEVEGVITDIFAKDHEEFMQIDGKKVIRLDSLISVNGIPAASEEPGDSSKSVKSSEPGNAEDQRDPR